MGVQSRPPGVGYASHWCGWIPSVTEAASLNRNVQPALAALLVGILLALGAFSPAVAAPHVPKVALIVGPVGSVTARYRSLADDAAAAARRAGAQVVKVYSPDATWPAVKAAVSGASIVVYLGHGNGWPSRYRDSLYPPSQNGFGLNPIAGADDTSHQYFGEESIDNIKLAKNAVVLLNHLCYASGNSEPGLPEGTLAMAKQRVDNYAAGFIRAGAKAVVAEGHMGPAWYVRQLLTTTASIETIWNRSPSEHGHTITTNSLRSAGFTARLDPDRPSSGFYRSLVSRGVTANELRSGAIGSASAAAAGPPPVPTLANAAIKFGTLKLATLPIASTETKVTIPLAAGNATSLPKGAQVGLRWDPILLDAPPTETSVAPQPAAGASPGPSASPAAGATPSGGPPASPDANPGASASPSAVPSASTSASPSPSPSASASPSASPSASASTSVGPSASPGPLPSASPSASATVAATPAAQPSPTNSVAHGLFQLPPKEPVSDPEPASSPAVAIPQEAPAVDLVVPERTGSIVEPARAQVVADGLSVPATLPTAPGLYRLVPTLHTPSGVAYDAATQALLTPVLVRIGGRIAVAYGTPSTLTLAAGMDASIPVRVLNSGSEAWDLSVTLQPGQAGGPGYHTSTFPAVLTGTWVSTTSAPVPGAVSTELDVSIAGPGGDVSLMLDVTAPAAPGEYLLLLDTISPSRGSLSALGSAPALIRVTVTDAGPSPTPGPPQRED